MKDKPRITVVETPEFIRCTKALIADSTREMLVDHIAANPETGDMIVGTGGARKSRWARPGGGKRGGYRIVHFYYNDSMPVFLLTIFAKNVRVDLTQAERNDLKLTLKALVATFTRDDDHDQKEESHRRKKHPRRG